MAGFFEDDLVERISKIADINLAKGNRDFVKTAIDNSRKAPQVVMKITGYSHNKKSLKAHTSYITTKSEETTKGVYGDELSNGKIREKINEWVATDNGKLDKNRIALKMVLSSPKGSKPKSVEKAVINFANENFSGNHDYYHALHTDTDNPHVHIVVRMRGYDGKKLDPKKTDLKDWRNSYSSFLEKEGIKTSSTTRASRGVGKKGISQKVHHMKKRGIVSLSDAAINKSLTQIEQEQRPWEEKQKKTNNIYRQKYTLLGESMENSSNKELNEAGKRVSKFAKDLPVPETRKEERAKSISDKDRER